MKAVVNAVAYLSLLVFVAHSANVPPAENHPPKPGDASPAPTQPVPGNHTEPKLSAFQESNKSRNTVANYPGSHVTITVGEETFAYTVNGRTQSRERIAVSGEYFNDELNGDGYARLFIDAQPSIIYYAVRPLADRLDVYVQNYFYEEFYYEIFTPYPVSGYDLRHGQINATAILVTGPSRSAIYGRKHSGSPKSGKTASESEKPFYQFQQQSSP